MSAVIELDPQRQKQAKAYNRIKRRMWLVDTLVGFTYLALWLGLGWSMGLRQTLESVTTNPWLLPPLYAAIFGAIYFAISLPLGYYTGFVLPHQFGQSNQSLKDWVLDQVKGLAVGAPIGLLLLELFYLALRLTGDTWWVWATGGMLLFSVLLANLAPVLIMPIFNKFVPLGQEHADLEERLLRLAKKANTHVQGVFKFDMSRRTKSANAALTGIGKTRRIVLGDTLINEFSSDEVETVLAHELAHHVHKDIPILILFGTITTALGFYLASLAMNWAVAAFGFRDVADVAALPALALILGVYSLVTSPVENAVSRWRERKADEYALQTTGKGKAFASAFVRLANQNLGEVDPEPWVVFMFYSHPPLGERIHAAEVFGENS
jgi:STE24 endopeptidase